MGQQSGQLELPGPPFCRSPVCPVMQLDSAGSCADPEGQQRLYSHVSTLAFATRPPHGVSGSIAWTSLLGGSWLLRRRKQKLPVLRSPRTSLRFSRSWGQCQSGQWELPLSFEVSSGLFGQGSQGLLVALLETDSHRHSLIIWGISLPSQRGYLAAQQPPHLLTSASLQPTLWILTTAVHFLWSSSF